MIEKIFVLHHTHVDFGYTDTRAKVCDSLVHMVDHVIDLVEKNSNNCESERFRWIHEVSWPVIEYIRRGGKRQKKLFAQIREGLVELTAMYMNPTDLFDGTMYEVSIGFAHKLAEDNGFQLTTAMFSDTPGIAWGILDILASRGIKYISASPNFIMSYPLEIERPFFWQSPTGNNLLTWCSDWRHHWYAEGMFYLKLHEEPELATERLLKYISDLESNGYKWKGLAIHFAMDNAPPEPKLLNFLKYFNAAGFAVKASLATNKDFFEFMTKYHAGDFEIHKGAWPDWWANGNASAAYEISCSRKAKASLERSKALGQLMKINLDAHDVQSIMENIFLFDEHTWGHMDSVKQPWNGLSRLEWCHKRAFALRALQESNQLETSLIKTISPDKVVVINPFPSEWNGIIHLNSSSENDKVPQLKDIESTEEIIGQRSGVFDCACSKGDFFQITVPSGQIRILDRAEVDKQNSIVIDTLENSNFRIENHASGEIRNIYSKKIGQFIFDNNSQYSFAELIHEKVRDGNREALYDFSCSTVDPNSKKCNAEFLRSVTNTSSNDMKLTMGPVFCSIFTAGELPNLKFKREVRFYNVLNRIDVLLHIEKQVCTDYESVYLAFPFNFKRPELWIENSGAIYRPGVDQLPGSATDWQSIGKYMAITNGDFTLLLVSRDVPLVQLGNINTGKWARAMNIENGHVFSWIMNNMWFTNFPAYQEGDADFVWSLTLHKGSFDKDKAEEFAHNASVGILISQGR